MEELKENGAMPVKERKLYSAWELHPVSNVESVILHMITNQLDTCLQ